MRATLTLKPLSSASKPEMTTHIRSGSVTRDRENKTKTNSEIHKSSTPSP